jgi:hypothetical protein
MFISPCANDKLNIDFKHTKILQKNIDIKNTNITFKNDFPEIVRTAYNKPVNNIAFFSPCSFKTVLNNILLNRNSSSKPTQNINIKI